MLTKLFKIKKSLRRIQMIQSNLCVQKQSSTLHKKVQKISSPNNIKPQCAASKQKLQVMKRIRKMWPIIRKVNIKRPRNNKVNGINR